ncbi:hypothetical protein [Petroclostridium sp. X23]|uniref:hypothetical protein n=1 Tax=Petroclostridium sp. X23 TaxID=3045146 RepID=UPI0024AE2088|nr:hypothetical protein [Petroclostridium sp. X23]WHH58263.1 hypothetical protein QKW49_21065 [Petroclostridium sp. X23]
MLEAISYEGILNDLKQKHGDADEVTIGILFGDANSPFMKEYILNRINQYHHRSSYDVDFYFPGYGAYWHGHCGPQKTVCCIDGVEWLFSDKMFSDFINDFESMSKWSFSGEVELILLNYRKGQLDFSELMVFWLDRMVKDNIIYSPANFFEMLFRKFRKSKSIHETSDELVLKGICNLLIDEIKKHIPLSDLFSKNKYFCTYSMSQ